MSKKLFLLICLLSLTTLSSCNLLTKEEENANTSADKKQVETMNININGTVIEVEKDNYKEGQNGAFAF